ncbi:unnamed protein product [Parascedosporium putredinis]|uniref:C2H2-type domain-containing protein n=1 Tax=Parascedosporium putredinis TaxID=1442378 RepID=A0A9P1H9P6_9PEZI|nr:unnamed protein product [Parascedosporium putredinis]CAI8001924.1 unnamed protein product [Parascedosporium putredinis]
MAPCAPRQTEIRTGKGRGPGALPYFLIFSALLTVESRQPDLALCLANMGKKKRKYPDIEERDFEDLKLLISHQKAKHFKCEECGRRLNTAGGLSVHMNQVHKETLSQVENALPNRQGLDVEIFAQEDRRIATGNPTPGTGKPQKKIKIETKDELQKRLADWKARKAAGESPGATASPANGGAGAAPGAYHTLLLNHTIRQKASTVLLALPVLPAPPARPGLRRLPWVFPPSTPKRNTPGARWTHPPGYSGNASTVDELVSGAAQQGDDIDQLIRMAEAGVKPGRKEDEAAPEKKTSKKDKSRMFYSDADISPEERMAQLPRYALAH